MYLILYGEKGRYDRQIDIELESTCASPEQASEELKRVLVSWMLLTRRDDELLEELNYDYDKYRAQQTKDIRMSIAKAIAKKQNCLYYNDYDSYSFRYDDDGNLTMITTGCPSDNEYCGETYQVVYI